MTKKLKTFKEFYSEQLHEMVVIIEKCNPPTKGYSTFLDHTLNDISHNNYCILIPEILHEESSIPRKERLKFFREMYPKYARRTVDMDSVHELAESLYNKGYNRLVLTAPSDIISSVESVRDSNGKRQENGIYYYFSEGIKHLPPSTGKTVLRESEEAIRAAQSDHFDYFKTLIPEDYSRGFTLFNTLRESLGLEALPLRRPDIQFPKDSKRERYYNKEIFNEGDYAKKHDNTLILIKERGPNFVVDDTGKKYFVHQLSPINEEEDTYKPPAGAKSAAKKALKWKDEHGDEVKAMTKTGWARANQLASGESLSYDTVKRMSNFARHKKNSKVAPEHKDEPWKDNGHVAWLGWGGDAGIEWAQKIVDKKEKSKEKNEEYGAGFEGTDGADDTYRKDTPGETPIKNRKNKKREPVKDGTESIQDDGEE